MSSHDRQRILSLLSVTSAPYRTSAIILVLALLFTPAILSAENQQQTPKDTLSLAECIGIALDRATEIKKAAYAVRLQGSDILKSYGQFLPKVSVNATYTPRSVNRSYSTESPSVLLKTTTERLDISLSTSLNIFNGLSDYAGLQAALQRKKAAGMTLWQARQTIVYDITQAYYQVLLNRELLRIAEENLSASKELLQLTRRQYEIGLKPVTDYYQQEAETASSELSVIKAENNLRQSRIELQRRLRTDPTENIAIADIDTAALDSLPEKANPDSLIGQALTNRKDLESASATAEAARWEITRSRAPRYPSLDLSFNLGTDGYGYYRYNGSDLSNTLPTLSDQLSDQISYTVALSLNWSIFDGFLTQYNVEQATINYLNQELDAGDLEQDIVLDVRLASDNYNAAQHQIDAAEQSRKAAEKAFQTIQRKYELGAATFVEVQAARAALVAARSDRTQAVYNLALQQNILDFTTGSIPVD